MVRFVREARKSHGVVIDPGAWTHYSSAIHDALEGVLKVEFHLSDVHTREPWRRHPVISPAVDDVVAGMGTRLTLGISSNSRLPKSRGILGVCR